MPSTTASFYQESKHGWFWYEDPAPVEEDREEPAPVPTASVTMPRDVSLAQYSTETLWNMHPDDFQQLLNGLQKKAVQYPTEQNILEYLSIQDIARRKALAYANATQYVTQKRADLFNINQVYPTSSPGVIARVQMQQEEIAGTIREAGDDHALLFFVAPGCGFCEKQAQILAYFVDKYGWQVKPVDIEREPNLALRFNITTTPTLLLIRQDREASMRIATGVATLPEIERNLYQAIRSMRGETSMESFTTYDFQKGSALDPTSILKIQAPWQANGPVNKSSTRPAP
jgi:conjugal transfer pilus assembly protein TraF